MLSFLAPLLGLLLLTGQNVIFSFFQFRKREFRADQYAAENADPDALKRALRTLERASLDADLDRVQSDIGFTPFTPFVPSRKEVSGFVADRFSLFFGGFALSKAHPSVEERIDRINRLDPD